MDFFAHIVWMHLIFNRKEWRRQAIICGVLPDLLSFGIGGVYAIFLLVSGMGLGRDMSHGTLFYFAFHNLVVWGVVSAALFLLKHRFFRPFVFGYGFHVIVDILVHKGTFVTAPLFPFVREGTQGIVNSFTPAFALANWSLIALASLIVYREKIVKKFSRGRLSRLP